MKRLLGTSAVLILVVASASAQLQEANHGPYGYVVSAVQTMNPSTSSYNVGTRVFEAMNEDGEYFMKQYGTNNYGTLYVGNFIHAGGGFRITFDPPNAGGTYDSTSVSWTRGIGAPAATCGTGATNVHPGSLYSNIDTTSGAKPLYVCSIDGWKVVAFE